MTDRQTWKTDCFFFSSLQGRAGLVAYRRSKGGVNAVGKAFYKGWV